MTSPVMPPSTGTAAYRASILHFLGDPAEAAESAVSFVEDGVLVVENGRVREVGDAASILASLPHDFLINDLRGQLIVPGFVDTHIHFAQADIIASYGRNVLDWLEQHTFPEERRFSDAGHAHEVAEFTVEEMLRNGTTTSMVFATVHKSSTDAIFRAAESRGLCMIAGKVLMDRHCPDGLCEATERGIDESRQLIQDWHQKPGTRLRYAVTPRFAPTSTEAQLELAGKLLDEHAGVYLQTHLAENIDECGWVRELFPWSKSYLDVYEHFGLLRPRSVYAHCIHLDASDRANMGRRGAAMAFCPTSNLFLGSGLFDADDAHRHGVRVGIGTDVGGGTSFSILRTLHEAYKVLHLRSQQLDALQGLYLATLGGARALSLDDEIGNFMPGKFADFVVLDQAATPLIERRLRMANSLAERLFVTMMLGDEHMVAATYVQGKRLHSKVKP